VYLLLRHSTLVRTVHRPAGDHIREQLLRPPLHRRTTRLSHLRLVLQRRERLCSARFGHDSVLRLLLDLAVGLRLLLDGARRRDLRGAERRVLGLEQLGEFACVREILLHPVWLARNLRRVAHAVHERLE
jgi:hypothetical protein